MTHTQMRDVDIHTVQPDTLVDIDTINIDMDLPKSERMLDFVKKAKNPYCLISNGIVIKIEYTDTTVTIDDRMESYLRTL